MNNEQKYKMYMKLEKKDLASMLVEVSNMVEEMNKNYSDEEPKQCKPNTKQEK